MVPREAHLGPHFVNLTPGTQIALVCAAVVEQIELYQLHPLIFELEKRTVDASLGAI
jgi:hypothetical protein